MTLHDAEGFADGRGLETMTKQINTNLALIDTAAGVSVANDATAATSRAAIGSNCSPAAKAVVSSTIKTASPTVILTASGKLRVHAILLNTDATGLAGGTNFQIKKNSTVKLAETVSNLGASAEVDGSAASVTALSGFVMDNGDTLSVQNSVADGTGAGVITITLLAHRLTVGASLS